MKNLQKLQKLVANVDQESLTSLTREELQQSISEIIDFLAEVNKMNRGEFSQVSAQLARDLSSIRSQLQSDVERHKSDLSRASGIEIINNFRDRLETIEDRIQARLAELKDGKDGISPDIEEVVQKLAPFIPKGSPDTGVEIRNKLEHLEGDERLSVDAIAGLEEKLKKNVAKGGGPHALSQLVDVDVVSTLPTEGQGLAYDATLKRWKPSNAGSGDVVKAGTPVNNQVGVWTGDGTIEGDAALTFDTTTDTLSTTTSGVVVTGSIELGAASDTTISRASAGVIAVEGNNVLTTATGLPLAGGTMSGDIVLGENTGVKLDTALSADEKWSGITAPGVCGYATSAVGDLIYLNNESTTAGRWELADANLSDGYDKLLGICLTASAGDGDAITVLLMGTIASAALPDLTSSVGSPVYMSETAGDVTVTQPTTADVAIRVVGHVLDNTAIMFNPDNSYITHT